MIIILMRMTLTLLFMSDFWLGIINLKNANRLKKDINEELMNVVQHPKSQHLGHMKTLVQNLWPKNLLILFLSNI